MKYKFNAACLISCFFVVFFFLCVILFDTLDNSFLLLSSMENMIYAML